MRIITGIVQLSFSNIWEPISGYNEVPKYRTTIVIQKTDTKTLSTLRNAIDEAIREGEEKFGESFQAEEGIRLPLKDGDAIPEPNNYSRAYWLKASSSEAPEIVDQALNPIQDHKMVKSGDFVRVSLDVFPYSINGNYGVACRLGNIQLVRKGKRFRNPTTAAQDFSPIEN